MTIREFYKTTGGDYDDIFRRIPSDSMITRFLLKFSTDPSYAALAAAREKHDRDGAFLARLADALRHSSGFPDNALFDAVADAYDRVIAQLAALL